MELAFFRDTSFIWRCVMVGEMREQETAGIAVEASLTGHLVFSMLHTKSAAETIVRLFDMGIDSFSFTDSLAGVLAQPLARRLCLKCRGRQPSLPVEKVLTGDTDLQEVRAAALESFTPGSCACRTRCEGL